MKEPCAQLSSNRKCRVWILLTSDMLTIIGGLLGICEIGINGMSD